MAPQRIYHDLIRVRNAVYWLRLYAADGGGHVGVVTEVPGNPGPNSMNGLEAIVSHFRRAFSVDPAKLLLFQIWPSGYSETTTEISRVVLDTPPRWSKTRRAVIERLVGKLPPLPDYKILLEAVAAQGGWVQDPIHRDIFEPLSVAELPPPHNPFRCAHAKRYDQILITLGRHEGDTSTDRELRAGTLFLQSLTQSDFAACTYHQADWIAIADDSVAILEELGTRADREDYQDSARKRLRGTNRALLVSLFQEPILIGPSGYTDGQHRGCALRFSGAKRAAVVVGSEDTGEFEYPWIYTGDG